MRSRNILYIFIYVFFITKFNFCVRNLLYTDFTGKKSGIDFARFVITNISVCGTTVKNILAFNGFNNFRRNNIFFNGIALSMIKIRARKKTK